MSEGRVDDEMIEISDPNEESTGDEPPPKVVVIEYRERGIPWMLVPPLLIMAAVLAVFGYTRFNAHVNQQIAARTTPGYQAAPVVDSPKLDAETPSDIAKPQPDGGQNIDRIVKEELEKAQAKSTEQATAKPVETQPGLVEKPVDPLALPPLAPANDAVAVAPVAPPTDPAAPVEKPVEPSNFPKTTGFGFDPKLLEAERKNDPPKPDPELAPVAQEAPPRSPAGAAAGANPVPIEEMDPDLLPPDPKLARVRQKQRMAEALQKVEADRARFHSDLRELCRIRKADYVKELMALSERYGMVVDPNAKKIATQLLGKYGKYAGADRAQRIDVLRGVGFPEGAIVYDIFEHFELGKLGERTGPGTPSEAMYKAILYVLRFPPGRPAVTPRSAATPGQTPPPPVPAYSTTAGGR